MPSDTPPFLSCARFGTIMAYGCPFFSVNSYEYLNVYSTPELDYLGIPIGTVDREDCARRIQETMVSYNVPGEVKRATPARLRILQCCVCAR